MPRSRDLLADAATTLAAVGVPSPQVDALLLLEHATGRPRHELRLGTEVTAEQAAEFGDLVSRRAERLPVQHLVGRAPFRYLELQVGPGVFIPRPETELIVDEVLRHLAASGPRSPVIVDLCTGSGALAIALASEVPRAQVLAVELSDEALAWTARNVQATQAAVAAVGSTLTLLAGDATQVAEPDGAWARWRGRVDVVVTNPPYVPDAAVPREPEVRDHDPAVALYGGPDGLDLVRPLLRQAATLLRPGGLLLVEHADAQGEQAGQAGVPAAARALHGGDGAPVWSEVVDLVDLAGRPRHTRAVRSTAPAPVTAHAPDLAAGAGASVARPAEVRP